MNIAETRSFAVGPFTIWQRPRKDNPAFAQYLVYLADKLLGKSFSLPDLGCCEWIQRNGSEAPNYAQDSRPLQRWTAKRR